MVSPDPPEPPIQTPREQATLRMIADSVPALIAYYVNRDFRYQFANRGFAEYNGGTPQGIVGRTIRETIGEEAWAVVRPYTEEAARGRIVKYVREQTLPDGEKRMVEVNLIPHVDDAGANVGTYVLINDISDHWAAEREARDSAERMRKFAAATDEGIAFHKDTLITDVNEAIQRMVGYTHAELVGRKTLEFVAPAWKQTVIDYIQAGREDPYEAALLHKDGHEIPVEMVAKTMPFKDEPYRLVVVRDIRARKEAQQRIEFMARHDALTQLPNRSYMLLRLEQILALARRHRGTAATLFIDLDNFKTVNDSLGHHAGDALLCEAARRIQATVREADVVSRLGGDEFLVVLSDTASGQDAILVAEKLLDAIRAPMTLDGHTVVISSSIGISMYPDHGESADELIRHADAAMYHAKDCGRNNYQVFARSMADRPTEALGKLVPHKPLP